jgi:hypothetical protein
MSSESRRAAGILLVVLPTVIFGGVSILSLLISPRSGYMNNPLRQDLLARGACACRRLPGALPGGVAICGRGGSLRPPEKLCAVGAAGGGDFAAGGVFLFGAHSKCD